jgi:hypothetical protein
MDTIDSTNPVGLSEGRKRELLHKLFWDKKIDLEYVLELLHGAPERSPGDKTNLYLRLLTTYDWYTLLKLLSPDRLKDEVLSESVVALLFPKGLGKKYQYARRVLSK